MNNDENQVNIDLDDEQNQAQYEEKARQIEVELNDGKGGKKNVALDDIDIKFDEAPRGSDAPLGGAPTSSGGDFSGGQGGQEFEKTCFLSPVCFSIRRFFNWVGAILATISSAMDVLYLGKAGFYAQSVYLLMALLWTLRIIVCACIMLYYVKKQIVDYKLGMSHSTVKEDKDEDEQPDEAGQGESEEEMNARSEGKWLYTNFFSLFYLGFYRVLPSDGYGRALAIGYAIDLFLNLIPMMLCQIWTNAEAGLDLTPVQSWAIILKVFMFLSFIFELSLMTCEIYHTNKLQKLEVRGYEKPTEEKRRAKAWCQGSFSGIGSAAAFLLIVIAGLAATKGRSCGAGHALELAVCNKCERDNCAECTSDSRTCSRCQLGYSVIDGKCRDCDSDSTRVICEQCDNGRCKACAEGYRLHNGACERCGNDIDDKCASCSANECTGCISGYYLDQNKICRKCESAGNPFCEQCDNGSTCKACNSNIATVKDGKCIDCNTNGGWFFETSTRKCRCLNGFVDVRNGFQCKKCEQLIAGCAECKYVTETNDIDLIVNIGYSAIASPQRPEEKFVKCIKAGAGLVTETIQNNQSPTDPNPSQPTVVIKKCDDLIPGCADCNSDGTSCNDCKYGFYKYMRDSKNKCATCQNEALFGYCNHCSGLQGCTECKQPGFHFGYKCYKKLWRW